MSNLIFKFKAYNPNKRTTYFIHKGYTDYIANSPYVLKNENTSHGLFGEVKEFPNIQNDDNITPILEHIDNLAFNKVPIYQEKDLARKNITSENYILNELKKVTSDEKLLQELLKYEKNYNQTRKIRALLKDSDVKQIVDLLIELKKDLKETTGSIKYQYLMKYPDIIEKVNNISNLIIDSSVQCKIEVEKYIKAKQKLEEFKYSDKEKLEKAMLKAKEEAQEEIIKLIGNQILNIERKWLNADACKGIGNIYLNELDKIENEEEFE